MHLLAVSGMHVGIVVGAWALLGRLGWLSRRRRRLLLPVVGFGYAVFTGAQPPVLRAALLLCGMGLARHVGRYASGRNLLAGAALVVWLLNPASWFAVGTQLSFLAVGTLYWLAEAQRLRPGRSPLEQLVWESRSRAWRVAVAMARRCRDGWGISVWIFLVTAPLAAGSFQLLAPIGILLGPVLLVPVAAVLLSGMGMLCLDGVPVIGAACGAVCDASLAIIATVVARAQGIPFGRIYLPGEAGAAVALPYVLIGIGWTAWRRRLARRWVLVLLLLSLAVRRERGGFPCACRRWMGE